MSEETIKQYYERIEKLLNGGNKNTYGFVPEEIRQILKWYEQLQQENQQLRDKYNQRERKWEKWNTEKSILSSRMSEYLCKYQNIKREYKNQNNHLCKYKKENQLLKHRLKTADDFIESRKENMIPEHYDDLKYIINECDLNSSW